MSTKHHKWWTLSAILTSIALLFTDQTVLPVALPTIQRDFHATEVQIQWMVNAYMLSWAVLVLAGGILSDSLGHRRTFVTGIIIFALSSILCGISWNSSSLIAGRAIQGVGSAFMVPAGAPLLLRAFPPNQKGMAMGLYVSLGSFFLILGPLVGGLFTEYLSWRWVFWINVPIAAIGLILTYIWIAKYEGVKKSFDFPGFITFSLGFTLIIFALMESRKWGLLSTTTIMSIVLGLFFLGLLYFTDKRTKNPYFDFRLFKSLPFFGSCFAITLTQFLIMITVYWVIFFQNTMGYSPLAAGEYATLSNIPVLFTPFLVGKATDRFGSRFPVFFGFLFQMGAYFWIAYFSSTSSLPWLLPGLLLMGVGIPSVFTSAYTLGLHSVPAERMGVAGGLISSLRTCGGTFGVAVFGTIVSTVQEGQFTKKMAENPETQSLDPTLYEGLLSKVEGSVSALKALPSQLADLVHQYFISLSITANESISYTATCLGIVGAVVALITMKKRKTQK